VAFHSITPDAVGSMGGFVTGGVPLGRTGLVGLVGEKYGRGMRTRAVVLGGGGPVGRGWQAGLVTGLGRCGVSIADADLIVGTSAGAIVGGLVAAGADPKPVSEPSLRMGPGVGELAPSRDLAERARVARAGLAPEVLAQLMTEEESLGRRTFAPFAGLEWPSNFGSAVVRASTGEFRLLRAADGVPFLAGVAASAALPGVFPPITVEGEYYVDGALRSILNADQAAGHDVVVVIAWSPPSLEDEADLATLREAGSKVVVVLPEARLREAGMLDAKLVGWAYEVGLEQAEAESGRLVAAWTT